MATKTFRTVYLNEDLDERLMKMAESKKSSISGLARLAVVQFLETRNKKMERRHTPSNGMTFNT